MDDFTPDAILGFLDALEQQRGNAIRTRNARLTAIRSFFAYLVGQEPVTAAGIHRILHIPFKKTLGRSVSYLFTAQVGAILAQVNRRPERATRLPPPGPAL